MNIKKGDTVQIITGKDRGKSGTVLRILRDSDRVVVEGLNVYKKHIRPKRQDEKGEVVQVARPISHSNVMVVCPACSKPTRIGYREHKGSKVRYCKKCDSTI